eukprot:scaffold37118_cov57-Phaeocystis_antarctica.AAC.3
MPSIDDLDSAARRANRVSAPSPWSGAHTQKQMARVRSGRGLLSVGKQPGLLAKISFTNKAAMSLVLGSRASSLRPFSVANCEGGGAEVR